MVSQITRVRATRAVKLYYITRVLMRSAEKEMAKGVLLRASLLLLCIAGGHSVLRIPACDDALARCNADTSCATLYATFVENCETERASTPANCTGECRVAMIRLMLHPLGSSTLFCDCGSNSTCEDLRSNVNANCFSTSISPGMLWPFAVTKRSCAA